MSATRKVCTAHGKEWSIVSQSELTRPGACGTYSETYMGHAMSTQTTSKSRLSKINVKVVNAVVLYSVSTCYFFRLLSAPDFKLAARLLFYVTISQKLVIHNCFYIIISF